jgi:hypothetical protein
MHLPILFVTVSKFFFLQKYVRKERYCDNRYRDIIILSVHSVACLLVFTLRSSYSIL